MSYLTKIPKVIKQQISLDTGVRIATLAGAETWDGATAMVQFLDCGGAGRTITLPSAVDAKGRVLVVVNTSDAAEDITITGAITISQNEAGILACDGSAWDGFIITGALA